MGGRPAGVGVGVGGGSRGQRAHCTAGDGG